MVRRAHHAGIAVLALTDHDTVAGVPEAVRVAAELGIRVLPGCEFSAQADWGEVHLLGYFLPVDDPALEGFLTRQREARTRRAGLIVAALGRCGVAVSVDDVLREAAGGAVGRPHVARTLVRIGAVGREQEAFDRWLGFGRPAYVAKELPTIAGVADVVHRAGGLLAAAHLGMRGTDAAVSAFRAEGVDGIEVRHPSHTPATERRLSALAGRYDLARTGGTDWHGDARARETGTPLGSLTIPEDWLADLEERHEQSTRAR